MRQYVVQQELLAGRHPERQAGDEGVEGVQLIAVPATRRASGRREYPRNQPSRETVSIAGTPTRILDSRQTGLDQRRGCCNGLLQQGPIDGSGWRISGVREQARRCGGIGARDSVLDDNRVHQRGDAHDEHHGSLTTKHGGA